MLVKKDNSDERTLKLLAAGVVLAVVVLGTARWVTYHNYLASLTPQQRAALAAKDRVDQAADAKDREAQEMVDDPKAFVTVYADQTPSQYDFKSVLSFDGTVTNGSAVPIKDPVIICYLTAPSGTLVGRALGTVYQVIPAGEKYEFQQLSMGFSNAQWTSASCRVKSLTKLSAG